MQTLAVEKREKAAGKARAVRRIGAIPGVVYGHTQAAVSLSIDVRAFDKAFKSAGEASVITLTGLDKDIPVLIQEVDLDPITNLPRHVDFYAITKGQKVEVAVPLAFVGESAAVENGANLIKVMHELEIEADPMNLPHEIEVDLSLLAALGDQIHVRDLKLPAGIELMVSEDEVVALVQEVQEEKVEEVAAADLSAIEVEKKGKEEEVTAAPVAEAK